MRTFHNPSRWPGGWRPVSGGNPGPAGVGGGVGGADATPPMMHPDHPMHPANRGAIASALARLRQTRHAATAVGAYNPGPAYGPGETFPLPPGISGPNDPALDETGIDAHGNVVPGSTPGAGFPDGPEYGYPRRSYGPANRTKPQGGPIRNPAVLALLSRLGHPAGGSTPWVDPGGEGGQLPAGWSGLPPASNTPWVDPGGEGGQLPPGWSGLSPSPFHGPATPGDTYYGGAGGANVSPQQPPMNAIANLLRNLHHSYR